MKKNFPESTKLVWILFLTGFVGKLGEESALWLLEHRKLIPVEMAKILEAILPSQPALLKISHALYWVCIPMLLIPFSYTFWVENRYVSKMYIKRDALEAGTIKPGDLTLEERYFIESHWPELFKS